MEQPKVNLIAIIGLTITSLLFFGKISSNYAKLESRLSVIEWKQGQIKEDLNDQQFWINQQHKKEK